MTSDLLSGRFLEDLMIPEPDTEKRILISSYHLLSPRLFLTDTWRTAMTGRLGVYNRPGAAEREFHSHPNTAGNRPGPALPAACGAECFC